ncbi:MAG: hypothetical protein ACRDGA_03320, partial [Bacteroidota bacterium]
MSKNKKPRTSIINSDGHFSIEFLVWLSQQADALLLETVLQDPENQRSYVFLKPHRVIKTDRLDCVE